jgi:hypothetical protein
LPDAAIVRLCGAVDERVSGMDKLTKRTKYRYLERITEQLDESAKGITPYVQLFFDFLVS